MKKLTLLSYFVPISLLFLVSCSKEKSFEGGTFNSDSVLIKKVAMLGSDSAVYTYGYDASKRLISWKFASSTDGAKQITIRRNAQGIILQLVHKSDSLAANGYDSLVYNVRYDATKSRYTAQVATFIYSGIPVTDSVAYTYNAAGKLTMAEELIGAVFLGGFAEYAKTDYTYDASSNVNNAKVSYFDQSVNAYEVVYEEAYEYDANVNPLKQLGIEAFLLGDAPIYATMLGDPSTYSTHNLTRQTSTDYYDPANDDVQTMSYLYNTQNKPAAGAAVYQSSSIAVPVTYFYK